MGNGCEPEPSAAEMHAQAWGEAQQHLYDAIQAAKAGTATDDDWEWIEFGCGISRPHKPAKPDLFDDECPF